MGIRQYKPTSAGRRGATVSDFAELTPGSKSAKPIPENGQLPDAAVAPSVQLDEIFRSFDPKTRAAFQTWMQDQAASIEVDPSFGRYDSEQLLVVRITSTDPSATSPAASQPVNATPTS